MIPSPRVLPAPPAPAATHGLEALAARFAVASEEMLQARSLLRRTDTKFLLPAHMAVWVLAGITRDYRIISSPNRHLARYQTIYYDTPDLLCFHDHRRGRLPRHKIRIRRYLDRDAAFFEIKTKQPNRETKKHRLPHPPHESGLNGDDERLIAAHTALPLKELSPTIVIDFSRMTLLSEHSDERMTIDTNLDFTGSGPAEAFDNTVMIEVKQRSLERRTPIMRALRAHRFRPGAASKYCAALAMAQTTLPRHHVRPLLRALERMQQ